MTRALTVVTPTFAPEAIGTPLYALDLVRWFADHSWDVEVITAQPFYPQFERFPGYGRARRHDEVDGIPVLRVPTIVPPYGKPAGRAISELNFAAQVALRSRAHRSASVLSITPGAPWVTLAGRALRRRGGRHVTLVHDVQSGLASSLGMAPGSVQGLLRRNERRCLQVADTVAVLTPQMGDAVRALGVTRPITTIPLWATVRVAPDALPRTTRTVQYSGNFGVKQGVDLLLPLAAELYRRDPSVTLLLRGAGHRFEILRGQIKDAGLPNVEMLDPVPSGELAEALALSPVHLVLQAPGSADYAMPSKVVNALSCGSSVVAVAEDTSPLAKMASEVTGLHHVRPFDLGAAVDEILHLLADPHVDGTRREVAMAAVDRFSRDSVLRKLAGLL